MKNVNIKRLYRYWFASLAFAGMFGYWLALGFEKSRIVAEALK